MYPSHKTSRTWLSGTASALGLSAAIGAALALGIFVTPVIAEEQALLAPDGNVHHRTVEIDGLDIFYREAGDPTQPTVLLLHGFPTSSHMFRDLIPTLARDYHVLAPDYPGYGRSEMPSHQAFDYTFANMAEIVDAFIAEMGLEEFSIYLMDYGAPIGYRVFAMEPERVSAFIIQNGNAYLEGLEEFWDPIRAYWESGAQEDRDALRRLLTVEATEWQYTHGQPDPSLISPDTWINDQYGLDRAGNQEIQLDMFYDYRTNLELYPDWQALFREHQPPTLITWGVNDHIFPEAGAHPYLRDLDDVEFHLLDGGHFVLESHGTFIATEILDFLDRELAPADG